jgi:uncharacterized protein YdbL (DUF1318 family)
MITLKQIAAVLCILLFASNLAASELSDARDAGLVQELPSGFIAATASGAGSPEILKMVDDINAQRYAAYEKIATKTGITVELVGQESYIKRHSD